MFSPPIGGENNFQYFKENFFARSKNIFEIPIFKLFMFKSQTKKISAAQIQHLADLARLKINDKETEQYSRELSAILHYVKKLNRVKTEKVSPTAQAVELENVFRADQIDSTYSQKTRKSIINQAPEKQGDLIKVKAIFE